MLNKNSIKIDLSKLKTRKQTAAIVARWRKQSGLNQTDMAGNLHLSIASYFYLETGKFYPNYRTIQTAYGLGYPVMDLFNEPRMREKP